MKLLVKKSAMRGQVNIPASKSHTIRAVGIASLAKGTSCIRNPLISSDALSSVTTYRALGAAIDTADDSCWKITGNAGHIAVPNEIIDVGNSGTTLRLATGSACLAVSHKPTILTGDHQIQTRPIAPLLNSLNDLGASCRSLNSNDKAPIEVRGTLKGGGTTISCLTSQYLSSLLLCCPLAANDTVIDVTLLNEPDYVLLTCDWLNRQGIVYQNEGLKKISIKGSQTYKCFDSPIPADFSSATFFLCGAAILDGDITVHGLDFTDSQPDKAVVDYLSAMGARIERLGDSLRIRGGMLKGIEIDMNKTPDALPAMAVVGAFAAGTTSLVNVPQARCKETDRIACMAAELKKMGARIEELPDGLVIHQSTLTPAALDGHYDHRIVMALAVAAMAVNGVSSIASAEAMSVTFPTFVELMTALGANMELVDH